ncbi:putative G-protein coupled receptor Mth-like 3 [Dufourea novaeangliae]|uniref:Putative G-protein coupled receptor Mth-like 3 n=1 Tax=Dufourea novaeangliae TaxID=178035 RepID=A0A154NYP2_DUFNO|nr:putative G-protein coupled receptor Mth-like 3 [Dufourea novaeangliae]
MTTRSLIVLALLLLSFEASSVAQLTKCCPPGEIFAESTNVNCVPVPSYATELNGTDYHIVDVHSDGIPFCETPEDVTTLLLSELNGTDSLQTPACIEILHTQSMNESEPIVVTCRANRDTAQEHEEPSYTSSEQLLHVRKCCPKNKILNVQTRNCETSHPVTRNGNYSNRHEFLSLLPKRLADVDFLDVWKGQLNCRSDAIFTYEIDAEDIVFEDGSLWATLPSSDKKSLERIEVNEGNTCLELTPDSRPNRRLAIRVCRNVEFCQKHGCIRKCCPEDQVFTDTLRCTKGDASSAPLGFYDLVSNLTTGAWNHTGTGLLVYHSCAFGKYSLGSEEIKGLMPNGSLRTVPDLVHSYDSYCLDVFSNGSAQSLLCFTQNEPERPKIRYTVTSILQATSCVFLFLTLLVYMFLPSLQNLHGKTLMCHSASLLLSYICLAIIPWVTPFQGFEDTSATAYCAALGYVMLFSLLSAFCWLNVMCFDIWRTFGRLRGNISRGRSHWRRFLLYSLYAWGLALFITVFCIASDSMYFLPEYVRPNFGVVRCWFRNDQFGEMIFFRGPVAIQLISNMVFFILTAEHCSKVKAEIRRVADPSDPRSKRFHADKTKLIMNMKLFVVMGITWTAEIASSLMNKYTTYEWKESVFYGSDAINCLQGVLIFILFVLKPRVYQALKNRLRFGEKKWICFRRSAPSSQGASTLQDPGKPKKSASNSTLTSSFAVSVAP